MITCRQSLFSLGCLSVVLALLLPQLAWADDPEADARDWHIYYFDERRPLELDVARIAVLDAPGREVEALRGDLEPHGLGDQEIRRWHVNWRLVDVPADMRGEETTPQIAEQLADAGIGEFISPVFLDERGHPMVVNPDVIVRFEPHVVDVLAEVWLLAVGAGEIRAEEFGGLERMYLVRPQTRSARDVLDIANTLAVLPDVTLAEPDMVVTAVKESEPPNDPYFNHQWGLHNTGQSTTCTGAGEAGYDIGALDAWEISKGSEDIIVVVFDDGIQQDHPDINQIPGEDFTGENGGGGPVNECDTHGTPVAGIVSAIQDNGIGVSGVAPNTKVASARIFVSNTDPCTISGSLSLSDFVSGLEWAHDIGARVTNTSLRISSGSSSLESTFIETRDAGMVHFASAGNQGEDSFTQVPAAYDAVNAVANLTINGQLASSSNYGEGLAFSAPGASSYSTQWDDDAGPDGAYQCFGGTSAASPHAAGVAALILSVNPSHSADEVEQIMQETAIDLGEPGYNTKYGWGLVNAGNALLTMTSCEGYCGGPQSTGCWCDSACVDLGDCCWNACIECAQCSDTIYVPGFASIQEAIDAVPSGTEIIVAYGTYNEALDFHGKDIHLRSSHGSALTTIDASGFDAPAVRIDSSDALLEGFTITGGTGDTSSPLDQGGGVYVVDSSATIAYCTIHNNTAEHGGGVYVENSTLQLIECDIYENAADAGGGVYITNSDPTIENCIIEDNTAQWGGGIHVQGGDLTLESSTIRGNSGTTGGGMRSMDGAQPVVTNCIFEQNTADQGGAVYNLGAFFQIYSSTVRENLAETGGGMYSHSSQLTVSNTHFDANEAAQPGGGMFNTAGTGIQVFGSDFSHNVADQGGGIWNAANVSAQITNTFFCGNEPDMIDGPFDGTIDVCHHHVPSVYNTIQEAIDAASDGEVILVAGGVYPEAIDLGDKSIHLRSSDGWENTTIDATGFDTSAIRIGSEVPTEPIIEGFTITGGTGTPVFFGPPVGGGLVSIGGVEGVAPKVVDCAFIDNTADSGAAIASVLNSIVSVEGTMFCMNDPDHITGDWVDLGGNEFHTICPWLQPATPPDLVVVDERCDEVTLSVASGANPPDGVKWYWQGTSCGTTIEYGSNSTFVATASGTYHLRSLNVDSGFWSENCASISVTVEPCPDTIHVPGDFASIQDAIDFANDGVEILVAPNTYTESLNTGGKAIHLRSSNGPDETILDMTGLDMRAITISSGEGPDTIIEGFTITGGVASFGAGMRISISDPVIRNCVFTENAASMSGGAISLSNSAALIESCMFIENSAGNGGAINSQGAHATIIESVFLNNTATSSGGGAIAISFFSNLDIIDCEFDSNSTDGAGGAVRTTNYSHAVITSCVFRANEAVETGGAIFNSGGVSPGTAEVSDSFFCDNQPEAIDGSWEDLGGNELLDVCPGPIPPDPPDPIIASESCDEATLAWPDGSTPPEDVAWYWQGTSCGESTALGSDAQFLVEESGTHHLRAKDEVTGEWSEGCGSVTVDVEPCPQVVNVPADVGLIQLAIELVADGGEIIVAPGTYTETIDLGSKNIHLHSTGGAEETIIDADGAEASVITIAGGQDETTIIEGLTVRGGFGLSDGGGILIDSASPTVIDCIVTDNVANNRGGGIAIVSDSQPIITNCHIANNLALQGGGGIMSVFSSPIIAQSTIEENFATGPDPTGGGGLYNLWSETTLTDCVFRGNLTMGAVETFGDGGGIYTSNAGVFTLTLTNCTFEENTADGAGGGIFNGGDAGDLQIEDSLFCPALTNDIVGGWDDLGGNEFLDDCSVPDNPPNPIIASESCDEATLAWPDGSTPPEDVAWYWQGTSCGESTALGSDAQFLVEESGTYYLRAKNEVTDQWSTGCGSVTVNIEPCPQVVNVPGDVGSIQAAIDLVADGGEVIVAAGTYTETIDLGTKNVHLRSSAGPDTTVIDAAQATSVIIIAGGQDETTIIEGFTITGGSANRGGGINLVGSGLTVIKCVFTGNAASSMGGGMMLWQGASATVVDCVFTNNTAGFSGGGMMVLPGGTATVADCVFTGNTASQGGGMYLHFSDSSVTSCLFTDNTATSFGGGIGIAGSELSVTDCYFLNNHADDRGGGISNFFGNPTITLSTFEGNTATFGGGVDVEDGSVTLIDSVFSGNLAESLGGGLYHNSPGLMSTVSGCTFEENTAEEDGGGIYNDSDATLQIEATLFCESDPNHVSGEPWDDLGGNEFLDECPVDCPGDLDGNGVVNVFDLLELLAAWGPCPASPTPCPADLDNNDVVNVFDLLELLAAWGPCE